MTRIEQIWTELENDFSITSGFLFRRYSGTMQPDVFIALKVPEKIRCIAVSVNSSVTINLSSFASLRDIQLEIIPDPQRNDRYILLIKLLNVIHSDIFSILCEDLMTSLEHVIVEDRIINILLNRFEKWKSLFDRMGSVGLSDEEQRGLYAELYLLRKLLDSQIATSYNILNAWVGPDRQIRDFQNENWAIEVKCTSGNNHQRIHISSERQLDISNLGNLFLFHLSLDPRQNSGETLINIINEILPRLAIEVRSFNKFKAKLLEAGYFESNAYLYEHTGYAIRNELFYHVHGSFPRIEEDEIRAGVGDVKYSIIVSQCSDFIRSEQEVFQTLIF